MSISDIKSVHQTRLATVLEQLLTHANLSTNAFAKAINFPPPTIHRILTGEVQDPRASTLNAIADYFGISIDQLFGKESFNSECLEFKASSRFIYEPAFSIPILSITEARTYEKHLNTPTDWLCWQNQHKNESQQNITNTFSVLLKNNNYDPPFVNGTHLIVNPAAVPASGDYVLIKFSNDSDAVIKKYIAEGAQKYLYPLKQDFKSIPFDQSDCSLIGVIIETYLKLKY